MVMDMVLLFHDEMTQANSYAEHQCSLCNGPLILRISSSLHDFQGFREAEGMSSFPAQLLLDAA